MDRILVNTAALLTATFYQDGVATAADGAVTVTVTSDDGTVIATAASTTTTTTGVYKYTLAARSSVDRLTLAWTGNFSGSPTTITTYCEITGGIYAPTADVKNSDATLSTYSSAAIAAARDEAEDEAERIMGRSFVRRYARDQRLTASSGGLVTTRWAHVRALRKVSATYWGDTYTITLGDCKILGDRLVYVPVPEGALVTLDYEHGLDEGVPIDLANAVTIRARQAAQRSTTRTALYGEVTPIDANGNTIKRSLPTATSTGVAEVDAIYRNYSLRFGIA